MHGVFGWGYEGQTVEDLIDQCRRVKATRVVDVRLNAISRKKGFSKGALSRALADAGIEYLHMRSLGNPKENRPGFAHPGSVEASRAHSRFNREVLDSRQAQEQLGQILALLEDGPIVFVCYEKAPDCCHRQLIIERVRQLCAQNSVREFSTASSVG